MATTSARWSAILAEAERSSLSQAAFARSRGINPRTLAWWKWKLGQVGEKNGSTRDDSAECGFVEVRVAGPRPVRLQLGRYAAHVLVDEDTDLELLRRILGALC